MSLGIDILLLILGLILVCKGGDYFVDSSVDIARALNIPRIVIGGTIVSIATTTPELTVSAMASWMGDSGIAIGNAVGSAIANIGLIVGCVACITPVSVDSEDFRRRSYWMTASMILVILFTWTRQMAPLFGAVLLMISIAYLFVDYWNIRRRKTALFDAATQAPEPPQDYKRSIVLFIVGIVMVILGSRMLVTSGISVATALGIPSVIIGLSIVAVGTSLPELVTGITAARKGVPDLSIGNIVGANVLNLALIVGISGLIHPLTLTHFTQLYSFPWLIVFVCAMIWMFRAEKLVGKRGGLVLLILYGLYLIGLVVIPMVIAI
jgi:cation:H+ antiporter